MSQLISKTLKEFGLTDDQILNIAIEHRITDAITILRDILYNKWNIDKLTAHKVVLELKKEFE